MASVTKTDNQPAVVTMDRVRGIANEIECATKEALGRNILRHCIIECTDMSVLIAHNRVVAGGNLHVSPRSSRGAVATYNEHEVALHLLNLDGGVNHVILIDASKFVAVRVEDPKY